MSAPSHESRTPTGVGSHPARPLQLQTATMPPDSLPAELWHSIIMLLDDHCFAWFVLRQVCPFLAHVTEDVFARYVSRTCSIRFAGQTLKNLLPPDLRGCDTCHRKDDGWSATSYLDRPVNSSFRPPPSFLFQPSSFVPAHTKARLVFRLASDLAIPHETRPYAAGTVEPISRLTQVFFKPGAEDDAERDRLIKEPHFVLYNHVLRHLSLPSVAIDLSAKEISLDWRRLCAVLMRDEFRCRYEAASSVTWWRKFE